jgi:hypothetical protein
MQYNYKKTFRQFFPVYFLHFTFIKTRSPIATAWSQHCLHAAISVTCDVCVNIIGQYIHTTCTSLKMAASVNNAVGE